MADKIDPHKTKERYMLWKANVLAKGIQGLSESNSKIIIQYIQDMEQGINVASTNKKGGRSSARLNSVSTRIITIAKGLQERNRVEILNAEEAHLFAFFADMRNGSVRRLNGSPYKSIGDYVKDFKAFWHWHMKVNRKIGIEIKDITVDLDTSKEKPDWVYLTEEQIKQLCAHASYRYEVLIWFLFDTGIRAPTELMNVKVSDLFNDFKELNIREETSKTFGRRIKLMLCSSLIKDYIRQLGLKQDDYLFLIDYGYVNKYLKSLAKKVLGDSVSPAGQKYSELTLYDFRHNSCCYWLPRYKSESALKYRFGWKKSEKIHYYTEFLGMRDTITQEDMLVDITKTEIEQKLLRSEQEKTIMKEEMSDMRSQISFMGNVTKQIYLLLSEEQKVKLSIKIKYDS
jgi:integrase